MANIILVLTGGVTASKQWRMTSQLQHEGHRVRCITTNSALLFLIPYYLKKPWRVFHFFNVWHPPFLEMLGFFFRQWIGVSHVTSAQWADIAIVAPATANSLSKLASGITDNFAMLIVRAMPRNKKVIIAPSMHVEMWFDPIIQENIDRLNQTGKYFVVPPKKGEKPDDEEGAGSMAAIEDILYEVDGVLKMEKRS